MLTLTLQATAWYFLELIFRNDTEVGVKGWFGCVSKSAALGIPLIDSMYSTDPNAGFYMLPLLI
jgi:hypothetical protein